MDDWFHSESDSSVWEHIEALRSMLIRSIGVFMLLCIPAWYFAQPVLDFLLRTSVPQGIVLHYFTVMEPFLTLLKLTCSLAFLASLPFTLYFIWQFVSPALMPDEKRMVVPLLLAAFGLAYAGIALTYFLMMPKIIQFSMSFAGHTMDPVIGVGSFVSLLLALMIACAILFQFPVLLYILMIMGFVSAESLAKRRSIVIVGILILAALLTPPDVVSQLMLAVPTWLLFELTIFLFRFHQKRDSSLKLYINANQQSQQQEESHEQT